MAIRQLRVYTGPEVERAGVVGFAPATARESTVRVTLGEILPMLADALAANRTWLRDFTADEIEITSDLHDVLMAYRDFRRPGA